jgi:FKBP-type peptidyl-prolyl cis-trans isomerase SlyD
MTVSKDKVVSIQYTLKDDEGEVLDSSQGREDLSYLHGHDRIVPGLEEVLEGRAPGESVSTEVQPEQGYGEYDASLQVTVPRDRMPQDTELEPGMQFAVQDTSGQQAVVTLLSLDDDNVVLDQNHPLAGKTLHFDVTINDVRDANSEELEHGHVHEPGHNHE